MLIVAERTRDSQNMMVSRRRFIGAVAAASAGLAMPRAFAAVGVGDRPALLPRALAALDAHAFSVRRRDILGLVDFGAPSGRARFHIIDIGNGRVLSTRLVAHGRGSDPANSGWVQRFSNQPGSNASCQGSFLTGDDYYGEHGRSGRLEGLDPENNLARSRGIVVHAAPYVSDVMVQEYGRIGRSEGCFAVSDREISEVLAQLGPGRLLFASK
jgi:hypothetical protein